MITRGQALKGAGLEIWGGRLHVEEYFQLKADVFALLKKVCRLKRRFHGLGPCETECNKSPKVCLLSKKVKMNNRLFIMLINA